MDIFRYISIILLSLLISGCSWLASFYIVNNTSDKIIINFTLRPTGIHDYDYALKDTLEFNYVTDDTITNPNKNSIDDDDLIGDSYFQGYSKQIIDSNEVYSVILDPKRAICGGYQLPFFSFSYTEERHRIFDNLVQMTIIRLDTKDTVTLKPSHLSDFSRPLGTYDIALILD